MVRRTIATASFGIGVLLWLYALFGWIQYLLGAPSQMTMYYTLVAMFVGGVLYVVAYLVSPSHGAAGEGGEEVTS